MWGCDLCDTVISEVNGGGEGSGVVELKQLLGCFGLRQIDSVFFLVDVFFPVVICQAEVCSGASDIVL